MGAVAAESARGGRRQLDAHINLVPYVDMLMTIMAFLVMTAVWTRMSALEVHSPSSGTSAPGQPEHPVRVHLQASGQLDVEHEGSVALQAIPPLAGRPDWASLTVLLAIKPLSASPGPGTSGGSQTVEVRVDDGVAFADVAALIDEVSPLGPVRLPTSG
jgi:hypothetical protein